MPGSAYRTPSGETGSPNLRFSSFFFSFFSDQAFTALPRPNDICVLGVAFPFWKRSEIPLRQINLTSFRRRGSAPRISLSLASTVARKTCGRESCFLSFVSMLSCRFCWVSSVAELTAGPDTRNVVRSIYPEKRSPQVSPPKLVCDRIAPVSSLYFFICFMNVDLCAGVPWTDTSLHVHNNAQLPPLFFFFFKPSR